MDLLKTPSVQSLLDSDLESVESFQSLDIEELDEVEYALPASEAPTLAEALSAAEDDVAGARSQPLQPTQEPTTCSALQVEFLQAVSQQLLQAQERSLAGAATTLSMGKDGRLTVGTAHGHLLSFQDQTLRWVCDSNTDKGAVSCLAYNEDGSRLLAGYARGLICQYESIKGLVLRRVMLGCAIWGTLKVTWAGTSGLVLDTGGSVWLVKFSRPLGVRAARTSCLFSGARGEVVALTARDARVLAMATLARVIVVAGGRASGVRLGGPPDTLPVLEWSECDERVLICARAAVLQWLAVEVTGAGVLLRPLRRCELKVAPLWLGWLGGTLAIFDADENLHLWGDDYDKPLDLSHVEPVYASAFFKGVWTEGLVSRALSAAGASALGGACAAQGQLALLGRKGVLRVRHRDQVARAQALLSSGRYAQGLRLLCAAKGSEAKALADGFVANLAHAPHTLDEKQVADLTIKICLKFEMSEELWGSLWESCSKQAAFVEALGDAIVRGELAEVPPSPDSTQALIERLAELEPALVERVIASLPLTSLDPHRLSVFARQHRLWRALGAVTAALSGGSGAMRELVPWVTFGCVRSGTQCACAGGALLVAAADALAGRGAGGRALPHHARPSARHDALRALLNDEANNSPSTVSPLEALVRHEARACVRLLEQCARDAPFAGPLAKANRRRVARALLALAPTARDEEDRVEILEFLAGQLSSGALPRDADVVSGCQALAATARCERADRAWLATLTNAKHTKQQLEEATVTAADRPRVLFRINVLLNKHEDAIQQFLLIQSPSIADKNELFEHLQTRIKDDEGRKLVMRYLPQIIELGPRSTAALLNDYIPDAVAGALESSNSDQALEFAEYLLECGKLKGEAAEAHLRNLCSVRANEVCAFLSAHGGLVRPEQALAVVRRAGVAAAEPQCLEAAGDVDGALDALLRQAEYAALTGDAEGEARASGAACALCGRAAAGSPRPAMAARWARVLTAARRLPPAALLDALAYVPLEQLIGKLHSSWMALTILECAAHERRVWAGCARVMGREAHEGLSRALRTARRGVACRGPCAACRQPLACSPPVRSSHCARAFHTSCPAETTCVCGRKAPSAPPPAVPRPARAPDPPPMSFTLQLVAPPRPDLEGIV